MHNVCIFCYSLTGFFSRGNIKNFAGSHLDGWGLYVKHQVTNEVKFCFSYATVKLVLQRNNMSERD